MHKSSTSIQIETWAIDRLIPYARNPRKNDHAVEQMCASIREFGFKIPCLVRSDGEVVDGHLRLKAARKLGISEVPVILCDEARSTDVWPISSLAPLRGKTETMTARNNNVCRPVSLWR
jgi:hypothetical protein